MSVILPGSYDPVTLGHLALIKKASETYDEVYAVIFTNPDKTYKFSLEDRVRMLILATDGLDNVIVSYSNGLVIDYMREHGIEKIIKGYRNDADLEYERKQAKWNLEMGGYETELWLSEDSTRGISSTLVRGLIEKGADTSEYLPSSVSEYIKEKTHAGGQK